MIAQEPHQLTTLTAEQAAAKLSNQIKEHGLDVAFSQLEVAIGQYTEAGYPIDALMPSSPGPALGFSLKRAKDGKSFWEVYAQVIREELCTNNGEFHKLAKAGLSGSAGSVLTAVMTGL